MEVRVRIAGGRGRSPGSRSGLASRLRVQQWLAFEVRVRGGVSTRRGGFGLGFGLGCGLGAGFRWGVRVRVAFPRGGREVRVRVPGEGGNEAKSVTKTRPETNRHKSQGKCN